MPDDTVLDGEVVALDENGRPSFNLLQNYGSAGAPPHFFIFDARILQGRDVMDEPLTKRRKLIETDVLPNLAEPIRYSPVLDASLNGLIRSVKEQGLEGRSGSLSSALWIAMVWRLSLASRYRRAGTPTLSLQPPRPQRKPAPRTPETKSMDVVPDTRNVICPLL
jgi:hypothetical protein